MIRMIRSIRLLNWRSHKDTKLEFDLGTNLLIGIMGAGKSSVLEGVAFALYGTFPALERRKVKLEDIVRLNEPSATIELTFHWENHEYKIVRTVERGKRGTTSTAEIFKNNALLENGNRAVSEAVHRLIGVDYDLFTRAIYSEQNNIDYFLNIDPRRRKEEIDALLGLDKFEEARANAVTLLGRFRAKRQILESGFSKIRIDELSESEKKHQLEVQEAQVKVGVVARELALKKAELLQIEARVLEMQKKKENYERLVKEQMILVGKKEQLAQEAGSIDDNAYAGIKAKLDENLRKRIEIAQKMRTNEIAGAALSKESGSIETAIKNATDAGAKRELVVKELEMFGGLVKSLENTSEIEQKILTIDANRKAFEREINEIAELLQKIKPGMAKCPICSTELGADTTEHIRLDKEKASARCKEQITQLGLEATMLRKQLEEWKMKSRRAGVLSESLKTLEKETAGLPERMQRKEILQIEIAKNKEERELMVKENETLSAEVEKSKVECSKMENAIKKRTELQNAQKRIGELETLIIAAQFDPKLLEEERGQGEKNKIECERLLAQKNAFEKTLLYSGEMLAVVSKELTKLRELELELTSIGRLENELGIFINSLVETQISLRTTLVEAINSAMDEIWPIFYHYQNYSALRVLA